MRQVAPAVTLAVFIGLLVPAAATAAPSVRGAEAALERKVEKSYRNDLGNGESVLAECRKRQTTRSEVRYRCNWLVIGGDPYADGYNGVERLSGNAWVYGSRRGRASYAVVLTA